MNYLVTGSAGFIGSAFVRLLLGRGFAPHKKFPALAPGDRIVSLDLLTYAASLDNLDPVRDDARHTFVKGDIGDRALVEQLVREHRVGTIVNFAAESHVDRSIEGSEVFVRTNVLGTHALLEAARLHRLRFVQVSTDEVYGTLGDSGSFTEETPLAPNSPYSASKAAADLMVRAYVETHRLDAVITRCSNNYGPYQFPEKFLPLAIVRLLEQKKIPVYGSGQNVRDWIHVEDHCAGVALAAQRGKAGEVYNLGGHGERQNLEMARELLKIFGRGEDALEYVPDRKGHDWRYAIDPAKSARELGWRTQWSLEEGLAHMVEWYRENRSWWDPKLPKVTTAKN